MLYQAATFAAKTLLTVIAFQIVRLVENTALSFINSVVLDALLFSSNACVFFIFNKFVFFYIFINILRVSVKFCNVYTYYNVVLQEYSP